MIVDSTGIILLLGIFGILVVLRVPITFCLAISAIVTGTYLNVPLEAIVKVGGYAEDRRARGHEHRDEYFLSQKKLDQLNEVIGQMESEIGSLDARLSKEDKEYDDWRKHHKEAGRGRPAATAVLSARLFHVVP
jgi:uncharacterized protein YlxW (UPF0749 family)